jgi:hypothetical protein
MKVIIKEEDSIHLNDINKQYIIVAILNNKPSILVGDTTGVGSTTRFRPIDNNLLSGDFFSEDISIPRDKDLETVKSIIKKHIEAGEKIEVFHQDKWKSALQWLIDNA